MSAPQPNDGWPAVATAVKLAADGTPLPTDVAEAAMGELMDGRAPAVPVAALLAMLRLRGETADEIAAFARVMRERSIFVDAPVDAVDLCGTGADGAGTFNVSTVAALVAAGAGVPVAKHGNRAITSQCGSADLVEALGIPLDPGPAAVSRSIAQAGFGFIFAPSYHPALRHAMPIRRELPIRTIFNLLGPLSSPARVRRQLLGVADPSLLELIAGALARLGVERALVVHGGGGLDELSLEGANQALLVDGESVSEVTIDAAAFGLANAPASALVGGNAERNRAIALGVLAGESGPALDVVLLNAGAALFVSGRAADVAEGVGLARRSIDSGAAAAVIPAATEAAA
jgi:anthranilate phosphoribosyltransferase